MCDSYDAFDGIVEALQRGNFACAHELLGASAGFTGLKSELKQYGLAPANWCVCRSQVRKALQFRADGDHQQAQDLHRENVSTFGPLLVRFCRTAVFIEMAQAEVQVAA